jgi:predicted CxxxxCH...CXXCH cytochrome family protein
VFALIAGAVLAAIPSGCLERRDDLGPTSKSAECTSCHGDPGRAGSPLARAAPPEDLNGASDTHYPGVGAHALHLTASATHGPLSCDECHLVPKTSDSVGHLDHPPPATIVFGELARQGGRTPKYNPVARTCNDTYCHRGSDAVWTEARSSAAACGTCHGLPPPAPHPQLDDCSSCHGAVVGADDRTMVDAALHVNGVVDVVVPTSCTACHGQGTDPAPVPGQPGAGAHRAHLDGSAAARAVPCGECHHVPSTVLEAGHLDTGRPVIPVFSGAATAGSGTPTYDNGSCQNTECHGAALADGNPSGGTNTTPAWTSVDGSQDRCGTCHALPPPAPHPYASLNPKCGACHGDIADDNRTFTHPELHVDGIVTFTLP